MLPITRTVVDETVRENLQLEDDRDLASRENRLVSIVATGEKTVIYVNSRDQSVALAKTLRKRVPDCATHIAFYNAGLARPDRRRVEEAFRDAASAASSRPLPLARVSICPISAMSCCTTCRLAPLSSTR